MTLECSKENFLKFESVVEEGMWGSFMFHLELVLLGLKPGTTPSVPAEVEDHMKTLTTIGLKFKRVKLNFVNLDELPEYVRELEYDRPYFVARDNNHLDTLSHTYGEGERSIMRETLHFPRIS